MDGEGDAHRRGIARGTACGGAEAIVRTVFCTSAENNIGVARMMDFIAKYGSSPVDREKVTAQDANGKDVEVALMDGDRFVMFSKR